MKTNPKDSENHAITRRNRLASETSSYLRSAAEQPVDWHPWSEEAFETARREDKPILLDIGAVWCHWCHVIDHESYDDPDVAAVINENFVPVKVDRDERPDVDRRYQEAVGAIAGQGGWPLTGFLTPDGKVFYGGTYFPPEDRYGRPGFKSVLQQVAEFYRTRKETALQQADQLYEAIQQGMKGGDKPGQINPSMIEEVSRQCVRLFDSRYGGFGTQPKFPHTGAYELLINRCWEKNDTMTRQIVNTTLTAMARGGVYDQLGGGFHRYSTDQKWIVPHFEKMSYDNSELLRNYIDAWQLTGDDLYRRIAEGIIHWTDTVLSDQDKGGFYASQDADLGPDDDGDYFTWTLEEARAVLSDDELRVVSLHYDLHEHGEMHHNPAKNVLHVSIDPSSIAKLLDRSEEEVHSLLQSGKRKLIEARNQRPSPFVDRTVYTNWNGMYIAAYLRAWKALGTERLRAFALRTVDRLLDQCWSDQHGFYHAISEGQAKMTALADDQVQMAWALLEAYEVTGQSRYRDYARRAVELALQHFWDNETGGFYDARSDPGQLGMLQARYKPIQDSPSPSTNGVAGLVLGRLYYVTGEELYLQRAEQLLNLFADPALRAGLYAATYFLAVDYFLNKPTQVVIVRPSGDKDSRSEQLLQIAFSTFRPKKLVMQLDRSQTADPGLPSSVREMLQAYKPGEGGLAYVCAGEACANPTGDPEELARLIHTFGVGGK